MLCVTGISLELSSGKAGIGSDHSLSLLLRNLHASLSGGAGVRLEQAVALVKFRPGKRIPKQGRIHWQAQPRKLCYPPRCGHPGLSPAGVPCARLSVTINSPNKGVPDLSFPEACKKAHF